jgi:hypothetical protein
MYSNSSRPTLAFVIYHPYKVIHNHTFVIWQVTISPSCSHSTALILAGWLIDHHRVILYQVVKIVVYFDKRYLSSLSQIKGSRAHLKQSAFSNQLRYFVYKTFCEGLRLG